MKQLDPIFDAIFSTVLYSLAITLFLASAYIAIHITMGASLLLELVTLVATGSAVVALYVYLKSRVATSD